MKARIALLALALAAGVSACTSTVTAPEPDRAVVAGTTPLAEEVGFAGGMGNGN